MFNEDFNDMIIKGKLKLKYFKEDPLQYFVASMMAGMYVCFALFFSYTVVGLLKETIFYKIAYGMTFASAFSFIVFCGSELFTGNIFVMFSSIFKKEIKSNDAYKLLGFCLLGNAVGCLITIIIFSYTGLYSGSLFDLVNTYVVSKTQLAVPEMFSRAILCNIVVCMATWVTYRCKSESGKLIMIFWCIFAFVTTGFEHSVVNAALFIMYGVSKIVLSNPINIAFDGILINLIVVIIGNIIGAIVFMALPYYLMSRKK